VSIPLSVAERKGSRFDDAGADEQVARARVPTSGANMLAPCLPLLKTDISPSWLIFRATPSFDPNKAHQAARRPPREGRGLKHLKPSYRAPHQIQFFDFARPEGSF
jgi:hypothetical protein